jgi:exonuclease SbcC
VARRAELASERAGLEQLAARQAEALDSLRGERQAALPHADAEAWRRQLDGEVGAARLALDAAHRAFESARDRHTEVAQLVDRTRRERDTALRAAETHEQELEQALADRRRDGVECAPTLAELEDWFAHLPDDVAARRSAWQARQQRLRELDALCRELEARLDGWRRETPSPRPAAEIEAALDSANGQRTGLLQAIGGLLERLNEDEARRSEAGARLAVLEAEREQARPWQQLDALIGAADGSAFRKYAQQFTLELLIEEANAHLARLARRYRLTRGSEELGLLVVDLEMGEELRSVHSLSGGETFLVSLALALGLSSLASQRVRVESLFIDEGFGSLDADTLNTAMEALDRLQSQGRRVGVISHVAEMAERIGVQVRVRPAGAGRSMVEVDG